MAEPAAHRRHRRRRAAWAARCARPPPSPLIGWDLPEHDLDRPESVEPLLDRDRPGLVIHTAAMTLVDECARQPELAMRRNGEATGVLAAACHARGVGLLVVSTNEVFSGDRADGQGYRGDRCDGAAQSVRRQQARRRGGRAGGLRAHGPGLWIVRTAWLYGPPGNDFPDKITQAADRLPEGEPLPVVADELGSPTYTLDLAGPSWSSSR